MNLSEGIDIDLAVQLGEDQLKNITNRTIMVIAAGDDYPAPTDPSISKLTTKAVVVGGLNPAGQISTSSQRGEDVTVYAPSDRYLQSYVFSEKSKTGYIFGSTVAAAALVTGTIADVLAIVPWRLDADEIKMLLKKTAIGGSLNYYKLLRVAGRLASSDAHAIYDDGLYDFRYEAKLLVEKEYEDFEEEFSALREAFFLDSNNVEVRTQLAEIYRQAGYETEALFYGKQPD